MSSLCNSTISSIISYHDNASDAQEDGNQQRPWQGRSLQRLATPQRCHLQQQASCGVAEKSGIRSNGARPLPARNTQHHYAMSTQPHLKMALPAAVIGLVAPADVTVIRSALLMLGSRPDTTAGGLTTVSRSASISAPIRRPSQMPHASAQTTKRGRTSPHCPPSSRLKNDVAVAALRGRAERAGGDAAPEADGRWYIVLCGRGEAQASSNSSTSLLLLFWLRFPPF